MAYTVEWRTIRTRFRASEDLSPPPARIEAHDEAEALAKAAALKELGCLVLSIRDPSGTVIMDFDEIWQAVAGL